MTFPQYQPQRPQGKSVPLQTSTTVPFSNGRASAQLGPSRAGHVWHVTRFVTVTANPNVDQCELIIYKNAEMPSTILDSTYDGAQAISDTSVDLFEGERIIAVWTCNTATVATLIVTGTESF